MSSYLKMLPFPSDRMGLIWALLALKDSYVVEYGPAGTTHFGIGPLASLGIEPRGRYYVTGMDEADVVMGDSSALDAAVKEIDQNLRPEEIFIVGSSVAATIGTDLEGICHYLQEEVRARLHVFESGGFKGNLRRGYADVYKMLAKHVPKQTVSKRSGYNLLGLEPTHYRWASDRREIQRLLGAGLGLEEMSSFIMGGQIRGLDRAASAEISLVLNKESLSLAQALEKEAGVPYLEISPYGHLHTLSTLEEIGQITGRTLRDEIGCELRQQANQTSGLRMLRRMLRRPPEFNAIGSPTFLRGLAQILEEFGFSLHMAVEDAAPEVERLAAIDTWHHALVFCDSESAQYLDESNQTVLTSFPWLRHQPFAEHLPFVGSRGADYIYEKVYDYLNQMN